MYVCGTNAFDPECDYMVRRIHVPGLNEHKSEIKSSDYFRSRTQMGN